ncbi:MAG: hypothetical protein ACXABO_16885 [Promethearchaeota archaeon]|jgi:hypothetical protein
MKPREILISILTAITLTTIVFIVMAIFLGVGPNNNYSESGIQVPNMGTPFISESNALRNYDSGNSLAEESSLEIELSVSKNSDVLEAELAAEFCIDTEPGVMIVEYEIPEVLPLCITETYLDSNLNITVWSYGGYTPDELALNGLIIAQPKTGLGGCVEIDWIELGPRGQDCLYQGYAADFDLDVPIQIDSNHLPEVIYSGNADWTWLCDGIPSENLDKWVFMSIVSSWKGCDRNDQKFKLILAHKSYFSEKALLQM